MIKNLCRLLLPQRSQIDRLGPVDVILFRNRNNAQVDLFGCISGSANPAELGSQDTYSLPDLPTPVQTIGGLLCDFDMVNTVSRYGMVG